METQLKVRNLTILLSLFKRQLIRMKNIVHFGTEKQLFQLYFDYKVEPLKNEVDKELSLKIHGRQIFTKDSSRA